MPSRLSLVFVTFVALGCGGGSSSAPETKTAATATETKTETTETKGTAEAPKKKTSKYPEPFMEPDCSSVPTDGYLPNAKKVIHDVRKANWDRLKACAEAANGESVSGEIRTSFRLDPDGVPRCVEAPGSSMANKDVIHCVLAVYRTFHFPKPKNGSVRVTDGIHIDVSEDED